MIAVLGFAGLKVLPDGLAVDPQLPAGWTTLTFRCQWHGRRLHMTINQGPDSFVVTLEAGEPMTLVVQGAPHDLAGCQPIHVNLCQGVDSNSHPERTARSRV